MKKLWISFLKKSILIQSVYSILILTAVTILFIVIMKYYYNYTIYDSIVSVIVLDAESLLSKKDFGPVALKLVYMSLVVFMVAIWQAILIFKMLLTSPDIKISKRMMYYSMARRVKGQDYNSLVFGIVNISNQDFFNVKIKCQLRVNIDGDLRHYNLPIASSEIPVLEKNMPYKIYIKTGKISNVNREAFLITDDNMKEVSVECEINHPLVLKTLEESGRKCDCIDLKNPCYGAEILVFVEVFDDFLDQNNITFKKYMIHDITEGKFCEITPVQDKNGRFFFSNDEICKKFDAYTID